MKGVKKSSIPYFRGTRAGGEVSSTVDLDLHITKCHGGSNFELRGVLITMEIERDEDVPTTRPKSMVHLALLLNCLGGWLPIIDAYKYISVGGNSSSTSSRKTNVDHILEFCIIYFILSTRFFFRFLALLIFY